MLLCCFVFVAVCASFFVCVSVCAACAGVCVFFLFFLKHKKQLYYCTLSHLKHFFKKAIIIMNAVLEIFSINLNVLSCIITGAAIGLTAIYASSLFPASNKFSQDMYKENSTVKPTSAEKLDKEQIDKLCDELSRRIPSSVSISDADVRNAVVEALLNPDDLDEPAYVKVISWLLFFIVMGMIFYLLNTGTNGGFFLMMKGLFPKEFETLGL